MSIAPDIKGMRADLAELRKQAVEIARLWPMVSGRAGAVEGCCSRALAYVDMLSVSFCVAETAFGGRRKELEAIRLAASAIGHALPAAVGRATTIMQCCCGVASYVTSAEIITRVAQRADGMPVNAPQAPVEETPLFAMASATAVKPFVEPDPLRALASLHRAGDHSLDPES